MRRRPKASNFAPSANYQSRSCFTRTGSNHNNHGALPCQARRKTSTSKASKNKRTATNIPPSSRRAPTSPRTLETVSCLSTTSKRIDRLLKLKVRCIRWRSTSENTKRRGSCHANKTTAFQRTTRLTALFFRSSPIRQLSLETSPTSRRISWSRCSVCKKTSPPRFQNKLNKATQSPNNSILE